MKSWKFARIALLAMTVPLLGACGDALGLGDDEFNGRFEYTGDVAGAPFYTVDGVIDIDVRNNSEALVDLRWIMRDEDQRVRYSIESSSPAVARISGDYIEFSFEGTLRDGSNDIDFVLYHEGRIRGRTMIGGWELLTEQGDEQGEFTAVR